MNEKRLRCTCTVYKRDCYRRTGRGKSGFSLYYTTEQCSRAAIPGRDCCKQHAKMIDRGYDLSRTVYHKFVD